MMNDFDFIDLMRKVDEINDINAKELFLHKARAAYQQKVLYADDFLMQIESALSYFQKVRELSPQVNDYPSNSNNLKISTCLIFELLKLAGRGRNVNDLTAMSKFTSIITGFSKENILNTVQKGFHFSERYHGLAIQEANMVLQRLQVPFQIDISKNY